MSSARLLSAGGALALLASTALAQTPAPPPAAPAPAPATTPAAQADVIETLRAQGQFTTLIKALEAAGMSQHLKTVKAVTVLAPTDAAFAALPPGALDTLLKPENVEKLRQLLLYHTINASVSSSQVLGARGPVPTGADKTVLLDGSGGKIKADAANVVTADIRASNGAIFAIDKVLDPAASPMQPPAAMAAADPAAPAAPAPEAVAPPTPMGDDDSPPAADPALRKAGDPGVVSNAPIPNPPETSKAKKPRS